MSYNPLAPFSPYLRPYRRALALGLVLLVVAQGISTLIPMVIKWAIDTGTAELDLQPRAPSARAPAPTVATGSSFQKVALTLAPVDLAWVFGVSMAMLR